MSFYDEVTRKRKAEDVPASPSNPQRASDPSKRVKGPCPLNAANLLVNGEFSDFTICTSDRTFKVHRLMLSGHSEFLDAAMRNGFKESAECKLKLPEIEGNIVAIILWYIYTRTLLKWDVSETPPKTSDSTEALDKFIPNLDEWAGSRYNLLPHAKLIVAADCLMLGSLVKHAIGRMRHTFILAVKDGGDNMLSVLASPDYEESMMMLWGQDSAQFRYVEDVIAWMTISFLDKSTPITCLASLFDEIPGYALALFKELHFSTSQPICRICKTHQRYYAKKWLIVHDVKTSDRDLIDCYCNFRGLCGRSCHVEGENEHRGYALCATCGVLIKDRDINGEGLPWKDCAVTRSISGTLTWRDPEKRGS